MTDFEIRERIYAEAKDIKVICGEVQAWSNHGEIDFGEIVSKLEGIGDIVYMLCADIREHEAELAREER